MADQFDHEGSHPDDKALRVFKLSLERGVLFFEGDDRGPQGAVPNAIFEPLPMKPESMIARILIYKLGRSFTGATRLKNFSFCDRSGDGSNLQRADLDAPAGFGFLYLGK